MEDLCALTLGIFEFYENGRVESHGLLRGINEIFSILCTFFKRFG